MFSEILAKFFNLISGDTKFCLAFGFDGYHLPNMILDERDTVINEKGDIGKLRLLKGRPCTMDVEKFLEDLQLIRDISQNVFLPIYCRKIHDPVPQAISMLLISEIFIHIFFYCRVGGWSL